MAHYNGNKVRYHKIKSNMLFSIDTIGSDVVNFVNEATIEAEKECGIKSSGYSIIFIPGLGMDITLSFLLMSDASSILLISIPPDNMIGVKGYLKIIYDEIIKAIKNDKEE